jgi:hypothetical protein
VTVSSRQSGLGSLIRIKSIQTFGTLALFSGGRMQPPQMTVTGSFRGTDFTFTIDESHNTFENGNHAPNKCKKKSSYIKSDGMRRRTSFIGFYRLIIETVARRTAKPKLL